MRLIEVETYACREFLELDAPPYAILSHTWGKDEVSFQDIQKLRSAKKKAAFSKIAHTCAQALKDGMRYVWVDTCCIDKSSSAELQEAINSMYRWYAQAFECYAYLSDVDNTTDTVQFQNSAWFGRGWTLQELIAPPNVKFYDKQWRPLGTRKSMLQLIADVTKIETSILTKSIFGVSIPMLYGEGSRGFIRLQEEILRTSNDHSIFAWGANGYSFSASYELLASSPAQFAGCHDIVPWGRAGQFEMTNRGLRIRLPVIRLDSEAEAVPLSSEHEDGEYLGILNCRHEERLEETLALRLRKRLDHDEYNVSSRSSGHDIRTISAVLDRIPSVEPRRIEIARSLEQRESPIKFWFRFSRDAQHEHGRRDFYPSDSWNDKRTIMRPPVLQGNEGVPNDHRSRRARGANRDFVRAGMSLYIDATQIVIAFGCRKVQRQTNDDTEAARTAEYYAPAICISRNPPLPLALECHHLLRCPYPEPCVAHSPIDCPYQKATCVSHIEAAGAVWQVSASIRQSSMMGETLFIIDAGVSCHMEVETIEPVVELEAIEWNPRYHPVPEATPYQEFEYPLGAVTGAWEVAKQFNADVTDMRPGLRYRAEEPAWTGDGLRALHGLRSHESLIGNEETSAGQDLTSNSIVTGGSARI